MKHFRHPIAGIDHRPTPAGLDAGVARRQLLTVAAAIVGAALLVISALVHFAR